MFSWLALAFSLELGFLPQGAFVIYEPPPIVYQDFSGSFYTELDARLYAWNLVYIGGGVKTFIWRDGSGWSFYPNTSIYKFAAGLEAGPVEIGFRHYCQHPTAPFMQVAVGRCVYEGFYEELFVRFSHGQGVSR